MKETLTVTALAAVLATATPGAAGRSYWGLRGSQADATLSRVDPVALRPLGRSLRLGDFSAERAFSPDRSQLAVVSQERPVVRFVELESMRATGQAELAGAGEVQWLRWTERGLVALVDRPAAGSQLIWLDPDRREVTRTLRYRGELVDPRLAAGRVVAVEWPWGRVGPVRLDVVDADGRARSTRIGRILGGWQRRGNAVVRTAEPALAVDEAGELAWLADGDGEICEVVLDTLAVSCSAVRSPAKTGGPWSRRQLRVVGDGVLALSGWEKPSAGARAAKAIGLWLVDTRTWRRRLLDREIDSFRFAQGPLVGVRRNGVTAYAADGARRYGIEEPLQLGVISTAGRFLYVPRTDDQTIVAELATGRILRRGVATVQPFADPDAH